MNGSHVTVESDTPENRFRKALVKYMETLAFLDESIGYQLEDLTDIVSGEVCGF